MSIKTQQTETRFENLAFAPALFSFQSRYYQIAAKMAKAQHSDELDQCKQLLSSIMDMPEAGAFLEPVDWKQLGLTDYPQIITKPMDLGTIKVWQQQIKRCWHYF